LLQRSFEKVIGRPRTIGLRAGEEVGFREARAAKANDTSMNMVVVKEIRRGEGEERGGA
jgi:hypothetical protein